MKNLSIPGISRRAIMIMTAMLLLCMSYTVMGQEEKVEPVADVFKVMKLASDRSMDALWPGFRVSEIPVLVFDSLNTYLFNSSTSPEGFVRSHKDTVVWVYKGQYNMVRGNSIVRMGEDWTATSVLSSFSRRTGEQYDLKDMAGIIVHEQFHIFQRSHHPGWRQNDGLLLIYPVETAATLLLRRMEKEAFKRAVTSEGQEKIAGWAKVGIQLREERLDLVPYEFANYENELQLTEGLSDYIEKRARDQHPLDATDITNGIAPAGIRDLGYVEGRWIAMILDKLSPDWKQHLEKNDSLYLEDILKTVVEELPVPEKAFESNDIDSMKAAAEEDFNEWQEQKKKEIEEFFNAPGYRIEIRSPEDPLSIRMFEPLEIEILDDRGVYHRIFFSAGNESGNLRIMNHPCITWFNDSYQITRLMINGLKRAPEIIEGEKKLIIKENGISIELNYSELSIGENRYIVEM
ncbi:MAG: hypothetical protein JW965_09120 [Bacteroidales bacterium]|nr:hypothetical protein [Bacteroidales bacterium]